MTPATEHTQHNWKEEAVRIASSRRPPVVVYGLVLAVLNFAPPLLARAIYDWAVPDRSMERLVALTVGAVLCVGWSLALHGLQASLIERMAQRVDLFLSSRLIRSLLGARLSSRPTSAGGTADALRNYENVREVLSANILSTLVSAAFTPIYLVGCFLYGGPVGFVVLGGAAALSLVLWRIQSAMERPSATATRAQIGKSALVAEAAGAVDTIKLLGAEERMSARWDALSAEQSEGSFRMRRMSALNVGVGRYGAALISALVLAWSAVRLLDGEMQMGDMIAVSMLWGQFASVAAQLPALTLRLIRARESLEGLDRVLSLPQEVEASRDYVRPEGVEGAIELRGVSFSYTAPEGVESVSKIRALDSISLSIPAGEVLGLMGASGSGKSTLASLLVALHRADEGQILLDGCDVAQVDPRVLRRLVGLHTQSAPLLRGTLRENLLLGRPDAPFEEVREIAALFGVEAMVQRHPLGMGWDFPISEGGANLSGGQRQLVTLARAFIANPKVVVLDEPTAHLDAAAEEGVKKALSTLLRGRTAILVSHRLSLLDLAHRVLVLDGGRLVGQLDTSSFKRAA